MAKYNGTTWSEVGLGLGKWNDEINCVSIDKNSGYIYAGGTFVNSNGKCFIAKWNGIGWNELGGSNTSTLGNPIESIVVDGSSNVITAGVSRNNLGGLSVAKWNGSVWSEFGNLLANDFIGTNSLVFDQAGNLYAGGAFKNVSGKRYIAKYSFCIPPSSFLVTGGGVHCINSTASDIILSNSEIGVTYRLYKGLSTIVSANSGTGSSINFGNQVDDSYFITASKASECESLMPYAISFSLESKNVWTGTLGTNWNTGENWCRGTVPAAPFSYQNSVTIPNGCTNYPVLSYSATLSDLTIGNQATLNISGKLLEIDTYITGGGKLIGSPTSSLVLGSSLTSSFQTSDLNFGSGISDGVLNDLYVYGNNCIVNLKSKLDVHGILSTYNATFNAGDGLLTLKSDINNTAVIGDLFNSTINGKVTVERYILQGYRTYRDLGAGVAGTTSIYNNWQEGGSSIGTNPGYGIDITGSGTSKGFDVTATNNASMWTYDNSVWNSIPNTNATSLDPIQGYRTLIRGDRNFPLGNPPGPSIPLPPPNEKLSVPVSMADPTTIRTTGKLVQGDVFLSTSGTSYNGLTTTYGLTSGVGAFSLIANPYWCPIDWTSIVINNPEVVSHITPTYYYFDPTYTYIDPATGLPVTNYVACNGTGVISVLGGGTSNINQYIQPGQAFFVQNDGSGLAPSLTIRESDKSTSIGSQTNTFGVPKQFNRLTVALSRTLDMQGERTIDGAVAVFDSLYGKGYGSEDSKKLTNGGSNVFISEAGINLCIDGLPIPKITDSILLVLSNMAVKGIYHLKIYTNEFKTPVGLQTFIADRYLHTLSLLGGDSTIIAITPTSDTNTYANRFSIVFKPSALPLKFTAFNATKSTYNILVSWSTADEANVSGYTVEKSTDGKTFAEANIQTAKNATAANYSWLDENAVNGSNYYRIKVVGKDGSSIYSNVVSVQFTIHNSQLSIFPNPVTATSFNLLLEGVATGMYNLRFVNTLGQAVMNKTLLITSASSVH